jgi:hypothetical protein
VGKPDHGGARENAGRKPKPKIEQRANKGIASEVLAMDGPPLDHERKCKCDGCAEHRRRRCKCLKVHEQPLPAECIAFAEHKICHCEVCGWWESLLAPDRRLRKETRVYLTDRRDGKPAQGVFIGDTREAAMDLDFGDLLMPASPDQPGTAGKPN